MAPSILASVALRKVLGRQTGRMPALAEVRDRIEAEWLAQRRQAQEDAAYARLREGYEVIIEPVVIPEPGASEASVNDP